MYISFTHIHIPVHTVACDFPHRRIIAANLSKICEICVIFAKKNSMKPSARYAVRAIKYFCWFAVLFALIISVLWFSKLAPTDNGVQGLFVNGWMSILEIAGVFLVFSAFYPKFGYVRRTARIPGEWSEVAAEVKKYFDGRGDWYKESEEPERLCFRSTKTAHRIARLWEDRLTVTPAFGGVEIEGPAKDVSRIASSMEYSLNREAE